MSDFATYAAIEAVNWSTLREAQRSPLHYKHRTETPREDTPRMAFGRAVHTAVLEPDRFALEYAVWDGPRRAGKEYDAFVAANARRTVLRVDEYEQCLAVRDAVRSHPVARRYLRHGKPEAAITWTDEATGLPCKARLDWIGAKVAFDLKTTGDIDARVFGSLAARMLYHGQLAFYHFGLEANGLKDRAMKVVAVEAEAPHDVGVYDVPDGALYAGEELVRELLETVHRCRKTRKWPGRYTDEQTLVLPSWVFPEDDPAYGLIIAGGK